MNAVSPQICIHYLKFLQVNMGRDIATLYQTLHQWHSPRGTCSAKSRSHRQRPAPLAGWNGHKRCDTQTVTRLFAAPCSCPSCLLESCPVPRSRWPNRTTYRPARTNTKMMGCKNSMHKNTTPGDL